MTFNHFLLILLPCNAVFVGAFVTEPEIPWFGLSVNFTAVVCNLVVLLRALPWCGKGGCE